MADYKLAYRIFNPNTTEPGLYKNYVLVKSWTDLVSDGDVVVNNSNLYSIGNTCEGDLVIPSTITSCTVIIGDNGRQVSATNLNTKLTGIYIQATELEDTSEYASYFQTNNDLKYCSNLSKIVFKNPSNIKYGFYIYTSSEEHTILPEAINELILPSSQKIIFGFGNCINLTKLIIPESVTVIDSYALANSGIIDLYYLGTVSQWNSITKRSNWNLNIPATVVHCSDGVVKL